MHNFKSLDSPLAMAVDAHQVMLNGETSDVREALNLAGFAFFENTALYEEAKRLLNEILN